MRHQWAFWIGADGLAYELFNGARTAHYLDTLGRTLPNGISITDVLEFGGCESYAYDPPCDGGDWTAAVYTTPEDDEAPWFDANYPESADALGFFIEEWTGLDDGHVRRSMQTIGTPGGGAIPGAISNLQRTMKLNVIMFALSEAAMQYLYDWLSMTLYSVCSLCQGEKWLIRRICPDGSPDLWTGVAQLRNVALVEGLLWEAPVVGDKESCYIRRASFTIAAGDPCMYLPDTEIGSPDTSANVVSCLNAVAPSTDRVPCRPSCQELDNATCRTTWTFDVDPLGAMGPIVVFDNDNDEHSIPLRATVYADPADVGLSPNPCGLPRLGQLYLRALPPWSVLTWDVVGRRVLYRDHSTGGDTFGNPYLLANDPPLRRNFAMTCGTVHIVVEPSTLCMDEVDTDVWSDESITFFDPHFPTMTVSVQERVGCA